MASYSLMSLTIVYVVVTSFISGDVVLEVVDALLGLLVLADFLARLSFSRHRLRDLAHPLGIADMLVIISFLAPVGGQGLGFLGVLRTLRLFRSYAIARRLKRDFPFIRHNYDRVVAVAHLVVFLFVMTAVVYETQHSRNPQIANYADALYFTVTTLTTTGYGDVTLRATTGRLLASVMMIVGVSLFLRLVQVLFRTARLPQRCPSCGLSEHETDASLPPLWNAVAAAHDINRSCS